MQTGFLHKNKNSNIQSNITAIGLQATLANSNSFFLAGATNKKEIEFRFSAQLLVGWPLGIYIDATGSSTALNIEDNFYALKKCNMLLQ